MSDETTRLRALLKGIALPWKAQPTIVDGDEVECLALVLCPHGDDGDRDMVAEIDMGHGVECDDAHAALIVAAVNALPGLLDAADRAGRELATATASVRQLRADVELATAQRDAEACRADNAEAERDDLVALNETRIAVHAMALERVAELEAIIAGRTTPPTDAEFRAHNGAWLVWWEDSREWEVQTDIRTPQIRVPGMCFRSRWWPLGAEGRPCAWPTEEVSRG